MLNDVDQENKIISSFQIRKNLLSVAETVSEEDLETVSETLREEFLKSETFMKMAGLS